MHSYRKIIEEIDNFTSSLFSVGEIRVESKVNVGDGILICGILTTLLFIGLNISGNGSLEFLVDR